jgi:hypothetical protein
MSARELARALGIAPRTRRFVLRDEYGCAYEGRRAEHVLAALSRSDKTPGLSAELHTVAHALFKSMTTGRMNASVAMAICDLSPYRVCGIVARVAAECPETTTGGICDYWLPEHQQELVGPSRAEGNAA